MVNFLTLIKSKTTWLVLGTLFAAVAVIFVLNWHDNQVDEAYKRGRQEVINVAKDEAVRSYAEQFEENKNEQVALDEKVRIQQRKVRDLEKRLLIDHDISKLLQAKPQLILNVINRGTEEALILLEEASDEDITIDIATDPTE